MRQAEKERQEARLRQLQIQEANRRAKIQELEFQLRMKELEQRKQELEASSQSIPSSHEIAANLQEAAPFEIAHGIILHEASSPTRNRLFVNIQLVDFKQGTAPGGPDLPDTFFARISCEDPTVNQLMRSGGLLYFDLFDKENKWIGQRSVSFADCGRMPVLGGDR